VRCRVWLARLGARHGFYYAGADVATRIAWALDLVRGRPLMKLDLIYQSVGTGRCDAGGGTSGDCHLLVAPDDPLARLPPCREPGDGEHGCRNRWAIAGACHGTEGFPRRAVEALHAR